MNPKEIYDFITSSFLEYFQWLLIKITNSKQQTQEIKNKEFGFVVLSILIGISLFRASQGIDSDDLYTPTVIIIICWLLFSVWTHFICKLFKGHGSIQETFSLCLLTFSFIYVLSNFAFFLVSMIPHIDKELVNPYFVYLVVQYILLSAYLPVGLKEVHGLTNNKTVAIGLLVPLTFVILNFALFLSAAWYIFKDFGGFGS